MKSQVVIAERELTRLMHNVMRTEEAQLVERLVRLVDLGQVLLGEGLIGRATTAVVAEHVIDESAIGDHAVRNALAPLRARVLSVIKELDWLQRQHDLNAAPLRDGMKWRGQQRDLGRVLALLRDDIDGWSELTLVDLRQLNGAVWPSLCRGLHQWTADVPAELSAHGDLQQLLDRTISIGTDMTSLLRSAETAVHLANATDYRSTLGSLGELVAAAGKLRKREPEVDLGAFGAVERDVPELLPRLERLVSSVSARLLAGVDRAFAIDRLILFLEHFEREQLLATMQQARNPEQVLQRAVDHFLFREGLYPVTNASVGRGRPDTLFELSPTQYAGMQCVLVELKQVVTNVSAASVRTAVDQALDQLASYSSSLGAHPQWCAHEIFCLVVYAGKVRYRWPSNSAVKLVYLGAAPPSAGATLLP
jgi:hypothetical protein